MYVYTSCLGIFIDINDMIYCSIYGNHTVVKKWLGDNTTNITIVAGNVSSGSASNQLRGPCGIFVDTNFDLYVADYFNDRIQLFRLGQSNGITVAGSSSSNVTIRVWSYWCCTRC
ncbi:hypothetical protein I4U23_004026 [Adineta vaga]|nr:hypothetical protein I4U23_004026 [Adineta vaga]